MQRVHYLNVFLRKALFAFQRIRPRMAAGENGTKLGREGKERTMVYWYTVPLLMNDEMRFSTGVLYEFVMIEHLQCLAIPRFQFA